MRQSCRNEGNQPHGAPALPALSLTPRPSSTKVIPQNNTDEKLAVIFHFVDFRLLESQRYNVTNRCASLSELFFFEMFTETDAAFQSRNLITAARLQLISRRCSSELFVNISADAARRRTSISARPRWPPRLAIEAALSPRRAEGSGGERDEPLISRSEARAC